MAARARTFGFAARFLPRERRDAATALYAYCRVIDDLADEAAPEVGVPALLAWERWLEWLEHRASMAAMAASDAPPLAAADRPLAGAIMALVDAYGVPPRYLRHLVAGARLDATRTSIMDFYELRAFCFAVAGTVGRAMAHVLGAPGEAAGARAEQLGIAMQLTNVLRDVGEDAGRGRVYLPVSELDRYGVTRAAIDAGRVDEPFVRLMQFQIARARSYYDAGLAGVCLLPPDCRLAILIAARLYRAILGCIERQAYDVFTRRATTSPAQKALTAATSCAVLAFGGRPAPVPAATVEELVV